MDFDKIGPSDLTQKATTKVTRSSDIRAEPLYYTRFVAIPVSDR